MTNLERAQFAANLLFTAENGEKAERLVGIAPDGRNLAGWRFEFVASLIRQVLDEATTATETPAAFALTAEQLRAIMPNLPAAKLGEYWPRLNEAMAKYGINTPLRAAAFLAQLAHESAEFRFMQEIWGPTDAQLRYDPPHGLARNLGNSFPGDGFKYRGRSPIQLTGRSNYKRYGELLGVDLVANPDLAAKPEYAFHLAALYWTTHGLNELADAQDFRGITKAINGGFNGLADREKYYERAKVALGVTA